MYKVPKLLLINELEEFEATQHIQKVEQVASELVSNNDQSHDSNHLEQVWCNCLKIAEFEQIKDPFNLLMLYFGTKFHELFDTKFNYDETNYNKVVALFQNYISVEHSLILIEIIKTISYKKEKEFGYGSLITKIPSEFILIRNIISDSDKIEALYVDRAFQYATHLGVNNVKEEVVSHCHDKLLKLKDNFIRTEFGKVLATPLHDDLWNFVNS